MRRSAISTIGLVGTSWHTGTTSTTSRLFVAEDVDLPRTIPCMGLENPCFAAWSAILVWAVMETMIDLAMVGRDDVCLENGLCVESLSWL